MDIRDIPKHNNGNLKEAYNQHQIKWRGTQSGTIKQRTRLSTLNQLFNIVLGILDRAINQLKVIRECKLERKKLKYYYGR